MLKLFTTPSCTSCRKAKSWLIEHKLEFEERNMMNNPLTCDELRHILSMTEEGTSDIISTRSKAFEKLNIDLDDLSIPELLELLAENPNLLRRPMMCDDKRLQIGFNEDEIRCFLPRNIRRIEMRHAQMMSGI
ncbi:regulatory protein spx [Pilibacter termitis]|uniref:Global transcriptional regulator Spx n=1 Tax=Pilibacter termitis TaxID=263852 RepID=A0A1T4PZ72_9ENTE|nr:transcriptional regulator SpxA [Pilibacter termitis]SJZ96834.1 regulatory protein spx [Pilibacter termitis]